MSIVKSCDKSQREARINHLEELMYHATTRPWKSVLNHHATCILEIERGNLKLGDNFQLHGLQSINLADSFSQNTRVNSYSSKQFGTKFNASNERTPPIRFSKNFQCGNCQFGHYHYLSFYFPSESFNFL